MYNYIYTDYKYPQNISRWYNETGPMLLSFDIVPDTIATIFEQ